MINGKQKYKGKTYIEVKDENNENACDECVFKSMKFCYDALSKKNRKKCYDNYSHWEFTS